MIRPTMLDLVRAVRASFADEIQPTLTDPVARSYAKTIDALLSQIENRAMYGQSLVGAENADLRETLAEITSLLDRDGEAEPARVLASAMRGSVAAVPAAGPCAKPEDVRAEAIALRGLMGSYQAALRDPENLWSDDGRARVQGCLAPFIERELRRELAIHIGVKRNAY